MIDSMELTPGLESAILINEMMESYFHEITEAAIVSDIKNIILNCKAKIAESKGTLDEVKVLNEQSVLLSESSIKEFFRNAIAALKKFWKQVVGLLKKALDYIKELFNPDIKKYVQKNYSIFRDIYGKPGYTIKEMDGYKFKHDKFLGSVEVLRIPLITLKASLARSAPLEQIKNIIRGSFVDGDDKNGLSEEEFQDELNTLYKENKEQIKISQEDLPTDSYDIYNSIVNSEKEISDIKEAIDYGDKLFNSEISELEKRIIKYETMGNFSDSKKQIHDIKNYIDALRFSIGIFNRIMNMKISDFNKFTKQNIKIFKTVVSKF